MEAKKVLAIVVTYNRIQLLQRCINSLKLQTYLPDILIINNNSSDGTEAYLQNESIPYITQENLGSAGGWWRGIDEAVKRNYDYVWMMDDDGFADANALSLLIKNIDSNTVCLSSTVVKENLPTEFVFGYSLLNKNNQPILFSSKRKYYTINELPKSIEKYPYTFLFNGALISIDGVKKIGNINKDFFLYGDEVDYFYRLRSIGKVETLFSAIHYHPDVNKRVIEKTRVYYFIRNTILLNNKYLDAPLIRNFFAVGVALARIGKRNGWGQLVSYILGENKKYVYQGILDGYKAKIGKRY